MKRPPLFHLPLSEKESSRLYWELAKRGAFSSGEKFRWKYEKSTDEELLTLALLQSRYDPRLFAVLVDFFKTPKARLHPIAFKNILRLHQALPIAAVLAEFVLVSSRSLPPEVRETALFLQAGVSPVPTQLFYRDLYPVGGSKMREASFQPLWAFKKWGFLASDAPLLKEKKTDKKIYLYDLSSRRQILKKLAEQKRRFRLKDYLASIADSISRQQALKDLSTISWIRKRGKGKGMVYEVNLLQRSDRLKQATDSI